MYIFMVYRKRKNFRRGKFNKKRGFKKRFKKGQGIAKSLGYLMPDKLKLKMPFRDLVNVQGTAGTTEELIYYGNSIKTPMISGGTNLTDVMLYDNMFALYRRCRVNGSKFTADIINGQTAINGSVRCTLIPTRSASALSGINNNDLCELKYGRTKAVVTPEARAPIHMKNYASSKRFLPSTSDIDSTLDSSAVPASYWVWHLVFAPYYVGVTDVNLIADIRIIYYVTFTSPAATTGS